MVINYNKPETNPNRPHISVLSCKDAYVGAAVLKPFGGAQLNAYAIKVGYNTYFETLAKARSMEQRSLEDSH